MLGFKVVLADGTEDVVAATHCAVGTDGSLVLSVDERDVGRYRAEGWIEVHALSDRLATVWPPANLDRLLDAICYELCVGLGDCGPLGPPSSFASGLFNELESFVAEVLRRVGRDSTLSTNRLHAERVRDIVRRELGLRRRSG